MTELNENFPENSSESSPLPSSSTFNEAINVTENSSQQTTNADSIQKRSTRSQSRYQKRLEQGEEDDKKWEGPPWKNLPHVALVNVFKFLPEDDRLEAQFVCRRWYDLIRNTPCIWRVKYFKFSGRNKRDLTHSPYRFATHFIKNFGHFIKKLEFRLYSPISSSVCKKFQKSIKVSLNQLTKVECKLEELSLPLLQLDRSHWAQHREEMCSSLAKFFKNSKGNLQRVYLRGARVNEDEGFNIINSLGCNAGNTVDQLDIEDFYNCGRPVYQQTKFSSCFKYFNRLYELDINYSYISNKLLDTLSDSLKFGSLKYMYIKVSPHEERCQLIRPQSWRRLKDECPKLKVKLMFLRVMTYSDHYRILCPEIPLNQVMKT